MREYQNCSSAPTFLDSTVATDRKMENFSLSLTGCKFQNGLLDTWRRQSVWSDGELLEYACAFGSFQQYQRQMDCAKSIVHLSGGLIGITSAILALWTFTNREFDAVSFMYHRIINVIELPMMALMIERAVRDYLSPTFLYSWSWATFVAVFSAKLENILPTMVNIITLFISFERAVACLAPRQFSAINRPCVVWTVLLGAFGVSLAIWVPSCFAHTLMYDNRTSLVRYMPVWTEWGKGAGYRSYNLIRHSLTSVGAILMILATLSAVIGLRRTAARSYRRHSTSNRVPLTVGSNGNGGSEYWYLLKQLSYLQLCETIPLIVLHVLLIAADSIHWDYKGGGQMAPLEVSFSLAIKTLALAKLKQRVTVSLSVANVAAHCLHFYWYLLLCPKVRRGFLSCLRRYGCWPRFGWERVVANGRHASLGSLDTHQTLDPQSIILRQSILSINGSASSYRYRAYPSDSGRMTMTFL